MTASFVDELREALGKATGAPQQYVANIRLERYGTPSEIAALAEAPDFPAGPFRERLDHIAELVFSENPKPMPCTRERVHDEVVAFRQKKRPDSVVVALSGQAGLLFVPTALQLQYFLPDSDLLVLNGTESRNFIDGIKGYADSFSGLADRIREDFALDDYKEIRTFGTSSGGVPAVAMGVLLDAVSMVSFGGHIPKAYSAKEASGGAREITTTLRRGFVFPRKYESRVFAVFAQDHPYDAFQAEKLKELMPSARAVPVEGTDEHNVISILHARGRLRDFYRRVGLLPRR